MNAQPLHFSVLSLKCMNRFLYRNSDGGAGGGGDGRPLAPAFHCLMQQ